MANYGNEIATDEEESLVPPSQDDWLAALRSSVERAEPLTDGSPGKAYGRPVVEQ